MCLPQHWKKKDEGRKIIEKNEAEGGGGGQEEKRWKRGRYENLEEEVEGE